jgi:cytoskeletal protein CcmA (bactofilin family)
MKKILSIVLAAVVLVPLVGLAATIKGGDTYSLGSSEVINDDLYAAGSNVNVSGTVQGDAVVAGGSVLISGQVQQGVLAAGGMVNILGQVANDVRVAGGNVTIGSVVVGDVVAAGGQITLASNADIGRDLVVTGGKVTIDGHVRGRVEANGGQVVINGPVDGNVVVHAGRVTLGSRAVINGNFTYRSPQQVAVESGAIVRGATNFQQTRDTTPADVTRGLIKSALLSILILFTSALIAYLLLRPWSASVVMRSMQGFWMHVLWGFIGLIILPILGIILMVTVIGLPLGLIVLFGYIVLVALSVLIAPIIIGSLIYGWWHRRKTTDDDPTEHAVVVDWKVILLGVVVYVIVSFIPFIGWLVNFIFILAALGTLLKGSSKKYQNRLTNNL